MIRRRRGVDTSITVSYGARANEEALRNALSSIAAFASSTFSTTDTNGNARYEELKQRVSVNLGNPEGVQKITDIEAELATAQTNMASGKDRQAQTKTALETMIDTISGVRSSRSVLKFLHCKRAFRLRCKPRRCLPRRVWFTSSIPSPLVQANENAARIRAAFCML